MQGIVNNMHEIVRKTQGIVQGAYAGAYASLREVSPKTSQLLKQRRRSLRELTRRPSKNDARNARIFH